MADTTYDISDIIDKTIYGNVPIQVYTDARDSATSAYTVPVGQEIGVLYSWLDPSASEDRAELWFMFWPDGQDPYYTKWQPGYNVDALVAQGVQSDAQKAAAAATAALPWYEQLITKYGPYILGAVLLAAAIKGYLSRPKSSNT